MPPSRSQRGERLRGYTTRGATGVEGGCGGPSEAGAPPQNRAQPSPLTNEKATTMLPLVVGNQSPMPSKAGPTWAGVRAKPGPSIAI